VKEREKKDKRGSYAYTEKKKTMNQVLLILVNAWENKMLLYKTTKTSFFSLLV
jgi:hypothetical protein